MAASHDIHALGAYDAKTRFSELLEKVETGQEFTITKHGQPVARLVPITRKASPTQRGEAIRRWRESSRAITLGKLKVRDLINQGRP